MTGRDDVRIVSGVHSVRAVLKHGADTVVEAWIDSRRRDRRLTELAAELRRVGIACREVDREALDRLARGANHQGVVVRARAPASRDERDLWTLLDGLPAAPRLLVLDGVQDPHNLGACLRTAEAAGVHAVVAPRDRSVGLTPVAVKVASGAADSVPFIQVTNLARVLDRLGQDHRIWIVGTAGEAETTLYEADLSGPVALVMGGEGEGLRRLTRERCDQLVRIPMAGTVESLNVSVAAGVCLFEAVRQAAVRDASPC